MKNPFTTSPLDEYSRNARLKPAFLTMLPLGILATAFGLKFSVMLAAFSGPLATVGLTFLLGQIGRDFGKRKEPYLYSLWSGKPSVAKMRHADTTLNVHTRDRYHEKAAQLLGIRMPTPISEHDDPRAADKIYEAYSNLLLERTRDKKQFPLIFQELTNYGFRRNLWGLKPIGLALTAFCLLFQVIWLLAGLPAHRLPSAASISSLAITTPLLFCWIFLINPHWVRIAADAYAERLLASSEMLTETTVMAARNPSRRKSPVKKTVGL